MKIIICDDDHYSIQKLSDYIDKYKKKHQIPVETYTFDNGNTIIEFLKNNNVELVFLDVMLINENGIMVAKKIRDLSGNTKIIFISAFPEFAVQGYDVEAMGYLLKPISYDEFETKMDKILERLEKRCFIFENTDCGKIVLHSEEIVYIETWGRNVKIHTNKEAYIGYRRMKDYEKTLQDRFFYRCHAAYLVNLSYVHSIDGLSLNLKNGIEISISKARKSPLCRAL